MYEFWILNSSQYVQLDVFIVRRFQAWQKKFYNPYIYGIVNRILEKRHSRASTGVGRLLNYTLLNLFIVSNRNI